MDISKKLKKVKISDIQPYKNNTKIHTQDQIDQIKKSIEKHGYIQDICVDKNNIIVIGHGRYEAMKQMGIEEIEVVDLSNVPAEDINKLRILDNKINESEWDNDLLEKEFKNIYGDMEANIDNIVNDFSFDKDFITDMALKDKYQDKEDAVDEVPEPEKPLIKKGDFIELGNHRLLCGDSTLKEDVDKLMGGKKADMVFTDPPYNVSIGTIKHPKFKLRAIKNDDMPDDDYKEFSKKIANIIKLYTVGCIYVCGAQHKDGRILFTELDKALHCSTTVIWKKDIFTLGRGKYQNIYEPIWFGWNTAGDNFVKTRNLINVWDIKRPRASELHPTTKPLVLIETAINHASKNNNIILDIFMGSGSTLIACEKTGRACYGMELDEWYCTVIIQRYVDYTGNSNIKINGKEVDWNKYKG
jgi:DNA modification methylase